MNFKELTKKKEYVIACVVISVILIVAVAVMITLLLSGNKDDSRLSAQCLKAQNEYREMHGVPDLQIDKELTKVAKEVAQWNADRGTFEHSKKEFGENLYQMKSSAGFEDFDCERAVKMWYDEYKQYDFDKGQYVQGTGHFTQLVWKDSKFVGCASAISNDVLIVACEYKPAGNVIGAFKKNVLPQT